MNPNNIVDVNKPVENPRLKSLLLLIDEKRTEELMNEVYEEIAMNAHFLSVILMTEELEQNDSGTAVFKNDMIIQFPMLSTKDGQQYFPAFIDWIEVGKWEQMKTPKALILSFDDYVSMVLEKGEVEGIVINPFSKNNIVLDRELIESLKTRKNINSICDYKKKIDNDTEVILGDPKNYPTEMVTAISNYLKNKVCVTRAWLRLMKREEDLRYLVAVEFSEENEKIFGEIYDVSRPYLNEMYIDIVSYEDEFGKKAVENVKPFYEQ